MTTTNNSNDNASLEGDVKQRAELASHPDLSEKLQSALLQDNEESVLVALAGNPSLFDEGQEILACIGSPAVRLALAANPSLNEKQQNYLVTTGSDEVKYQLASNPSLALDIQALLADDEKYGVRSALAANPALDKTYIEKLMCDDDTSVKCGLARNPALTIDLQQRMAEGGCTRSQLGWVLPILAKNASLSEELMRKLADSDISGVRESLACNSALPEILQACLISNNSGKVLQNLARNTSLKIAQQAELAHVGDVDARLALLENPSVGEPIKMRVMASFKKSDLSLAERDFEYSEQKANRLNIEYSDACKKYEMAMAWSMGWLFPTSDEKLERLYGNTVRIQEQERETWSEHWALGEKCSKLRALLKQQPKTSSDENGFSFGCPRFI